MLDKKKLIEDVYEPKRRPMGLDLDGPPWPTYKPKPKNELDLPYPPLPGDEPPVVKPKEPEWGSLQAYEEPKPPKKPGKDDETYKPKSKPESNPMPPRSGGYDDPPPSFKSSVNRINEYQNIISDIVEEVLAETSPRVLAGALDFDPSMVAGVLRGDPKHRPDPTSENLLKRLDIGKRARSNKDALRAVHSVLKRGTTGDYVNRLASALPDFSDYKDWYTQSSSTIDKHFKTPVTHYGKFITGLIAATSPQVNTGGNLKQALQAADDIIMGNPLSGMSSKVGNIVRAITDTGLSGQKVHSFHHNLSGNPNFTTVDSHELAGQLNDFSAVVSPEQYKQATMANRRLTDRTGWTPAETQAAVWAFDIARTGGNHPSFHVPGSPFHSYSELAGGHLPATKEGKPIEAAPTHSYGEYLDVGDNPKIIKAFTDRWDAKIMSDPEEYARVKDTHYSTKNLIRGVDLSKSDLKNPKLVATLVGKDRLLPDQTITNPYGDLIKQTAKEFNPELHRAIRSQRMEDVEYSKLVTSITETLLA